MYNNKAYSLHCKVIPAKCHKKKCYRSNLINTHMNWNLQQWYVEIRNLLLKQKSAYWKLENYNSCPLHTCTRLCNRTNSSLLQSISVFGNSGQLLLFIFSELCELTHLLMSISAGPFQTTFCPFLALLVWVFFSTGSVIITVKHPGRTAHLVTSSL